MYGGNRGRVLSCTPSRVRRAKFTEGLARMRYGYNWGSCRAADPRTRRKTEGKPNKWRREIYPLNRSRVRATLARNQRPENRGRAKPYASTESLNCTKTKRKGRDGTGRRRLTGNGISRKRVAGSNKSRRRRIRGILCSIKSQAESIWRVHHSVRRQQCWVWTVCRMLLATCQRRNQRAAGQMLRCPT